jgi:DNA-binding transcriptional LysR family regulator
LLTQQSTLSRCIRELEESIGVIVFERSSGGVCATSAGRGFSPNGAVDSRTNGCAGYVSQV